MYRISYRFLVPGWSAKPLVSAHDRIMGTHTMAHTDTHTGTATALPVAPLTALWALVSSDHRWL